MRSEPAEPHRRARPARTIPAEVASGGSSFYEQLGQRHYRPYSDVERDEHTSVEDDAAADITLRLCSSSAWSGV